MADPLATLRAAFPSPGTGAAALWVSQWSIGWIATPRQAMTDERRSRWWVAVDAAAALVGGLRSTCWWKPSEEAGAVADDHRHYVHRPKRARKRKAQAADMPVIVRAGKKAPVAATNGDDRKSAIVTAKNPRRGRFGDVPDMTREGHKRRGDAADALFREMKRQIAASKRS